MLALSKKDVLSRTVRMLTRDGTPVTFRGHTPFVQADSRSGKITRLNLPEIPESASPLLMDALAGYLDHEVGHIFYTPFQRIPDDLKRSKLANIFEDIRLEKLLPRDLPGTKDNLERMYVNWIPLIVQPGLDQAIASKDPSNIVSALLMPAMRALAGQKAFQDLMDQRRYWHHMADLLKRLPSFEAQVAGMETYDDVLACVERLLKALTPPPPPPMPAPPQPPAEEEAAPSPSPDDQGEDDEQTPGEQEEGEDPETPEEDGSDEGDGPEADEEGGETEGDGDGDESSDDADEPGETDGEDDEPGRDDKKDAPNNVSMTDALKQLEPTLRRALLLYKKRKKTIPEIATIMKCSEQKVGEMLRDARRELRRIRGA